MYSIPEDDPQLIYPEKYAYHKDEAYKSSSTVYDEPHIYLSHLGIFHPNDFSALDSKISLLYLNEKDGIEITKISNELFTKDGEKIDCRHEDEIDFPVNSANKQSLIYTITYNRKDVPENVIQIIKIEMTVRGKPVFLNYKFNLTRENVSSWDVLMGV
ncbi:MAG: hypothetical protein ACSHX0_05855 [Akkermansiaceae bacterium]